MINLKLKAVNDVYGVAVYSPIKITRKLECWLQTVTNQAGNYAFSSIKKNLQKQVDAAVPSSVMTNHADAEFHKDCPIVWSVVDKDKNDLLNW